MKLRAPSIPLITTDPYFTIWSPCEVVNYEPTQHWTGKNNSIIGTAIIDGEKYTFLGKIATCPALVEVIVHLYLAEGITLGEQHLDPDEFLDVELIHIDDLYEMVMSGEVVDSKTQIAILKAREILKNR
jgi:hypothetical protein